MPSVSATQQTERAQLSRPASSLNTEFDSRILRVSAGYAGMTRPAITPNGALVKVSCLHCGKDGGAVSASIPAFMRGDPGVIYVCLECDGKLGTMPGHAMHFERRA